MFTDLKVSKIGNTLVLKQTSGSQLSQLMW